MAINLLEYPVGQVFLTTGTTYQSVLILLQNSQGEVAYKVITNNGSTRVVKARRSELILALTKPL
jgi:hypothetical protein